MSAVKAYTNIDFGYQIMNTSTSPLSRIEYAKDRRQSRTAKTSRQCFGIRLAGFFKQLRERKVCRAAAMYAIFSWVILQLGEIIFPSLALPDWTLTLVVVVAIAGFPIAMILAWLLQWTDDGLVIDVTAGSGDSTSSRIDLALSIALLLAAVILSTELIWSVPGTQASAAPVANENPIALIPFTAEAPNNQVDASTIEQYMRYELIGTNQLPLTLVAGISNQEAYAPGDNAIPLNWAVEGSVGTENKQVRVLLHLVELPDRRYHKSWTLRADATSSHQDLAKSAVAELINYMVSSDISE